MQTIISKTFQLQINATKLV